MGEPKMALHLGRLAVLVAAVLVAGSGPGLWLSWRLAGRAGLAALAAGGSAVLLAFAVGLMVMLPSAGRGPQALVRGFLMAGPVRLLATAGLTLAAWTVIGGCLGPLLIWTAVFYVLLLAAEVSWLAGVVRAEQDRNG